MQVDLTPEAKRFVDEQVGTGHFRDASEVLNAAIEKLIQLSSPSSSVPHNLADLESLLLDRVDRAERGEYIDGETAYQQLRERLTHRGSK